MELFFLLLKEFRRKDKGGLSITKMVDCDLEDEVVSGKIHQKKYLNYAFNRLKPFYMNIRSTMLISFSNATQMKTISLMSSKATENTFLAFTLSTKSMKSPWKNSTFLIEFLIMYLFQLI